jgi:hypothetical protein
MIRLCGGPEDGSNEKAPSLPDTSNEFFLEELGLAVRSGVVDEVLLDEFFHSVVAESYERYQGEIARQRRQARRQTLYTSFQWLYERWILRAAEESSRSEEAVERETAEIRRGFGVATDQEAVEAPTRGVESDG